MRAANCQRSPRQNNNNNLPAASMEAVIRGRMSLNNNNPNTPLTSTGSTTSSNGSSSGYSSISGPGQNEAVPVASAAASNKTSDYACPPPTVPVPSVSSSSESSSGTCRIIPIIKVSWRSIFQSFSQFLLRLQLLSQFLFDLRSIRFQVFFH